VADHPYRGLPDPQFWSRAVTWAPPGGLDPVVTTRFQVGPEDRIATMGSCFAQHLSRHLSRSGLHYFVAEQGPAGVDPATVSPAEAARLQYGTFSARYGNVYTVEQAVQLFGRAYGSFTPAEEPWTRADGALVDPFRPLVEPAGFADEAALRADGEHHLAAVRSVFEDADVLVFTLGLTEAWRSLDDGAVFATAPGVNGGSWDPERYEFVNFDVDQVRAGLFRYCELARSVNPDVKILLTVSPVPLIATYEPRHVLVSTTVSKAVLRVAADEALRRFDFVDYFPSYEIISAASATRNYFAPDLREVEDRGVAHVMRVFSRHYVDGQPWSASALASSAVPAPATDGVREAEQAVICDEETVAAAIEASSAHR
jgi:hypothetical protein